VVCVCECVCVCAMEGNFMAIISTQRNVYYDP